MNLLALVRRTIRRHHLAGPDTRVVAALSGGPDSVALMHLLHALHEAGDLRLVGAAHFNHQLRATADRDERFCETAAGALHVPLLTGRGDVRALARREHRSIEDAARTARHTFLEEARVQLAADVVALGHTRDDQAETFLLRLLRGAGAKGLAAMHPRADNLIRPLLEVRRGELLEFLAERQLSYMIDESNTDVAVARNRVRLELLPLLAERFNPSVVDVLADEAEIARAEYWHLTQEAAAWQTCFVRGEGLERSLDADALVHAPLAVARMVLRQLMSELAGGRPVGFAEIERALALARDDGAPFDGPGQRVKRVGARVVLTGRPAGSVGRPPRRNVSANLFEYSLSIPGEVNLAELGRTLSARPATVDERRTPPADAPSGTVALVQLEREDRPLTVRNRRPGDRFQPPGLGHFKKLQDVFVDRKVARSERDLVPIVADDRGRIVWVVGHGVDEEFQVKDPAQSVIILRLKGVGGSA